MAGQLGGNNGNTRQTGRGDNAGVTGIQPGNSRRIGKAANRDTEGGPLNNGKTSFIRAVPLLSFKDSFEPFLIAS